MTPILTPRLRLEPLDPAHAAGMFPGLQNSTLYQFISEQPPESVEALRERYQRLSTRTSPDGREAWLNWALRVQPDGAFAGWVQATVHTNGSAHIAYVLFVDAWGKGYAREAASALLEHLRDAWQVRTAVATVDPRHRRSIALLEALAFRRGVVRRDADVIGGVPADEVDYLRPLG